MSQIPTDEEKTDNPQYEVRSLKKQVDEILNTLDKEYLFRFDNFSFKELVLLYGAILESSDDIEIEEKTEAIERCVQRIHYKEPKIHKREMQQMLSELTKDYDIQIKNSKGQMDIIREDMGDESLVDKQIYFFTQPDWGKRRPFMGMRILLTARPKNVKEFKEYLRQLLEFGKNYQNKDNEKILTDFKIISAIPECFYTRRDPVIFYVIAQTIEEVLDAAKGLSKITAKYDTPDGPYCAKKVHEGVFVAANPKESSISTELQFALVNAFGTMKKSSNKLTIYELMEKYFNQKMLTCKNGYFENIPPKNKVGDTTDG